MVTVTIVAISGLEKKILFAEVKLNKNKINLNILQERAKVILQKYPTYTPTFLALRLEDTLDFSTVDE